MFKMEAVMPESLMVTIKVTKMVIDAKATGANAKAARIKRGWTFREAAKHTGCSFAYLSDLEAGNRSWGGKIGQRYLKILAQTNAEGK